MIEIDDDPIHGGLPRQDEKLGQNKAEHRRRAAEALRQNLRRRKEQQRRQGPPDAGEPESSD